MPTRYVVTTASALALALLTATATFAQTPAPAAKPAMTLTGDWNVSLYGDHVVPVGMTLTQDAKKLTGTIMLPGTDVALTGDFVDGAITLKGKVESGATAHGPGMGTGDVTITATVKEDGTLNGQFAGGRGTIKLTAERLGRRPSRATPPPADPGVSGSVAGRWNVSIDMNGTPMPFALALTLDGDKVGGTITSDHSGELKVDGTFINGALAFKTTTGEGMTLTFTGALKDGDTLAGNLTGPMGALSWTAPRVKK